MDKTMIFIVIAVVLVGGIFWAWQAGLFVGSVVATPLPAGLVEFYGQGCPHCADVDAWVKTNNIDQKVKWTKLEVWYNKANQETLSQVAQKCGITGNSVGVPFLYDGNGKCYIGEIDVENFLKTQAGIK